MTISTTTLLWIAVIVLLAVIAWLLWQNLRHRQEQHAAPAHPAPSTPPDPAPRRPAPNPSVAPPPAMAGPPAQGGGIRANPGIAAGPASPSLPERMDGAPAARPRSAAPPPAAAGAGVPRAPERTATASPHSAPPPAASAGGGDRPPAAGRPASVPPSRGANPLLAARSWGYQLQKFNIERAAASPFDVLVIDYSRDGSDEKALRPRDLERLHAMPDGNRRIVLAYLSIGEAESYRYYWDPAWARAKPSWLLSENPEWKENYSVCFWDPGWQRLMCGTAESYLDKIISAGFDGVYLDKCDVFEDLERRDRKAAKSRPDLEADMVRFVVDLTRYAKSKAPGFLVVMQNAENLLEHEPLRVSIDAVAKEELVFGLSGVQRKNAKGEIADARRLLDLAKSAGKPVFVVEYLDDGAKVTEAAQYAESAGYVLYVAPKDRELDRLNYDVLQA